MIRPWVRHCHIVISFNLLYMSIHKNPERKLNFHNPKSSFGVENNLLHLLDLVRENLIFITQRVLLVERITCSICLIL